MLTQNAIEEWKGVGKNAMEVRVVNWKAKGKLGLYFTHDARPASPVIAFEAACILGQIAREEAGLSVEIHAHSENTALIITEAIFSVRCKVADWLEARSGTWKLVGGNLRVRV